MYRLMGCKYEPPQTSQNEGFIGVPCEWPQMRVISWSTNQTGIADDVDILGQRCAIFVYGGSNVQGVQGLFVVVTFSGRRVRIRKMVDWKAA